MKLKIDGLLSVTQVAQMFGVKRASLYYHMNNEDFPKAVRLTENGNRYYNKTDILEWLKTKGVKIDEL